MQCNDKYTPTNIIPEYFNDTDVNNTYNYNDKEINHFHNDSIGNNISRIVNSASFWDDLLLMQLETNAYNNYNATANNAYSSNSNNISINSYNKSNSINSSNNRHSHYNIIPY